MSFHYLRSPDEDGGVSRAEGRAPGTRLDRVLAFGRPPRRIALEIVAALCEILYIAHDDGTVHGDLRLEDAWLTGDGVVAVDGFDAERSTTSTPDGTPKGPATDLYGLGKIAVALLCDTAAQVRALPFDGAPLHDDAVCEAVMGADLTDLDEDMANDVRWFLIYWLSFDPADRPDALRAWQSFIAFARTVPGPGLEGWARNVVRQAADAPTPEPTAPPTGATATGRAGPLAASMSFASTTASKTLYWSRDELLEDAKVSEPERGGGQKTGHWSRADLIAMATGTSPTPQRAGDAPSPPAVDGDAPSGNVLDDDPPSSAPEIAPLPPPPPVPPPIATQPAPPQAVVASDEAPVRPTPIVKPTTPATTLSGQPLAVSPTVRPTPVVAPTSPVTSFDPHADAPAPATPRTVKLSTPMLVFLGAAVTLFLLAGLLFVAAVAYTLMAAT